MWVISALSAAPLASDPLVHYFEIMTLDEITKALRSTDAVPKAALSAGVSYANELAPLIYAMAEKFDRGIYLVPADRELLFYGLHILAAARHPGLCDQLVTIARQSCEELDVLFSAHTPASLTRLLLSVWDRGADGVFHLIEHGDIAHQAKWALYDVLARLTFDAEIPRERTLAFLTRIERDNLIEPGDLVWWGWEQAVVKLGLAELEPALRRVWSKPIYEQHSEAEQKASLDALHHAARDPSDPKPFEAENIRLIDDPVEAVAWVERQAAMIANWADEDAREHGPDDDIDATKAIRLTDEELGWLAGFLECRQVPESTMSLEMLDGFFTALIIGPEEVPSSEYEPVIWSDHGAGPNWDSPKQAEYVFELFKRHWNAIAARKTGCAKHRPVVDNFPATWLGEEWADGFMVGVDLRSDAWDQLFDDSRADHVTLPILSLTSDISGDTRSRITPKRREEIVEHLPATLQMIASYWRGPDSSLVWRKPIHSIKVGRNEPCPCGSGKKYKKCCGSTPPPLMH
jgi:uncharacterized protein